MISEIKSWYADPAQKGWMQYGREASYYRLIGAPALGALAIYESLVSAYKTAESGCRFTFVLGKAFIAPFSGKWGAVIQSALKTAKCALRTLAYLAVALIATFATLVKPLWGVNLFEAAYLFLFEDQDVTKDAEDTKKSRNSFNDDWTRAEYFLNGQKQNIHRTEEEKEAFLQALGGEPEFWTVLMHQGWGVAPCIALSNIGICGSGQGYALNVIPREAGYEIVCSGKLDEQATENPRHFEYVRKTFVDKDLNILKSLLTLKETLA